VLVDIAELRIPVGMLCTFNGLGVALQAEAAPLAGSLAVMMLMATVMGLLVAVTRS
jgi:biopolymer transport protein ExbB/TolQ